MEKEMEEEAEIEREEEEEEKVRKTMVERRRMARREMRWDKEEESPPGDL